MKKIAALLMATLMLALAFTGCAKPAEADTPVAEDVTPELDAAPAVEDSDLAYITGNGKMVIGITEYAPMNYYDDAGKLIGFDTEYAEAVCAKLGVTPEFVVINWDTKEMELDAKNIDCIWNGFTITEERKEALEFTDPYVKNMQVVVIKADNAATYVDTASLSGANLVAEMGSTGESSIADDENLSQANYVGVSKQTDALLEVKAGTADAAVIDYVMAKAMVGEGTDYADLMIVDGAELAYEEYGVGFRKGSDAAAAVNEATAALIAEGTLPEIAAKYGLALMAE
ncbi:MAG: transporter substrate-binding domain-containing protein [Clostridia bacterium]|nr:transporter substrate-binding domain-containing protein [Clostridia bacterium]